MVLDITQVMQRRDPADDTPPPVLVRLHNPNRAGVQILVTEAKAARLITEGTYKAVPTAEQRPKTKPPAKATTDRA